MHEIEKLEKKWLKYRFKIFIKKIFFVIIFTVAFSLALNFYESKDHIPNKELSVNKVNKEDINISNVRKNRDDKLYLAKMEKKQKKEQKIKKTDKKEENRSKNIVFLSPSTKFLSHLEPIKTEKIYKKEDTKNKIVKQQKTIEKTVENKVRKTKIVIKTKKDKNILERLIKKFEKNPDPKLAIFLSKSFFKKKYYKKALYWAIKANDLDSSNSESWILFAKTSVKLGKKDEAVNALRAYLTNYNSYKVEKLLQQILNGEYK